MATIIQKRYDTAANWTTTDPILAMAEEGYESDTGLNKVGDGSTIWSLLSYSSSGDLVSTNNLSDVANAITARSNLGLVIGTDVQAYDADTTKNDVLNTFTVSQRGTLTTDNDLSFDLAVTNKFKSTPTTLGTLTFTNLAVQSGSIILDNTGAFAISLGAMVKAKSGLATTLSTAGIYVIGYECDGTNVYLTSSAAMV